MHSPWQGEQILRLDWEKQITALQCETDETGADIVTVAYNGEVTEKQLVSYEPFFGKLKACSAFFGNQLLMCCATIHCSYWEFNINGWFQASQTIILRCIP